MNLLDCANFLSLRPDQQEENEISLKDPVRQKIPRYCFGNMEVLMFFAESFALYLISGSDTLLLYERIWVQ